MYLDYLMDEADDSTIQSRNKKNKKKIFILPT
jgi:hypothetical protein